MPKIIEDTELKPYWQTSDGSTVRLYHGDVIDILRRMPAKSVQMVVTSPPYWGLRDYGTDKTLEIGSEKTPDEFVAKMVSVFHEVYRVLRDDGTLWLNLGDTYGGGGVYLSSAFAANSKKMQQQQQQQEQYAKYGAPNSRLPSGNLVGIPWRVALALQADGWVLRQDIIWHKPSPMPESVRNRCTKAHEYIFLFTKRMGYFYDAEAIKEKSKSDPHAPQNNKLDNSRNDHDQMEKIWAQEGISNKRSVWSIASQGYAGAHFATYPPKLIEPCILAGTSEKGCCPECGAPWRRKVEEKKLARDRPNDYVKYASTINEKKQNTPGKTPQGGWDKFRYEDKVARKAGVNSCANSVAGVEVKTVGWEPTCSCGVDETVPCTVLDPFIGSGTTCVVCIDKGRRSIGIDLSEQYLKENAVGRIVGELMARPALAHLAGKKRKRVELMNPITLL